MGEGRVKVRYRITYSERPGHALWFRVYRVTNGKSRLIAFKQVAAWRIRADRREDAAKSWGMVKVRADQRRRGVIR